jgi:Transferase family
MIRSALANTLRRLVVHSNQRSTTCSSSSSWQPRTLRLRSSVSLPSATQLLLSSCSIGAHNDYEDGKDLEFQQRPKHQQQQLPPPKADDDAAVDTVEVTVQRCVHVSVGTTKRFTVPLTVADVHLRHDQLPFAYFFDETLCAAALETSLAAVLQQQFAVAGGRLCESSQLTRIECCPDDTIPLSFATINATLSEWKAATGNQGHLHQSCGKHPTLLPLFDPLFSVASDNNNGNNNYRNLVSVRVTYFACGATSLGVTFNHCLADTASCVRLVQVWGLEMMKERNTNSASPSTVVCSWNRSAATTTGMMTPAIAELLDIPLPNKKENSSILPAWMTAWFDNLRNTEKTDMSLTADIPIVVDHEYVRLPFSVPVLRAMKAHGTLCIAETYVSTNDMVTAFGWLLKRSLSQRVSWNIAVVVNLRGRCGVSGFIDDDKNCGRSGLFGNAISMVIAKLAPTSSVVCIQDVRRAAQSIRQALVQGILEIPDRIALSRLGRAVHGMSSIDTFSTTSWGQLSPWKIQFGQNHSVSAFHGQPAHPLPAGCTYSSVIHASQDGGMTYELFLPSDKADGARRLHEELCASYVDWHDEHLRLGGDAGAMIR